MRLALATLVLVGGCAAPGLPLSPTLRLVDTQALAKKHPHALAVLLSREERAVLTFDDSGPPTQIERHDTIAILAEGGERWAEVSIPVGDGRLRYLRARTIDAQNHIQEVTLEEVHTTDARQGSLLDGTEVAVKVFRFPGVHVGSVVEYAYGVAFDHRVYYLNGTMSAAIPVERYRLEVAVVGPADAAVRVYNTRAKIDQEVHWTTKSLRVEERDLRANRREPFAPPPSMTEPGWAVAITRALIGRRVVNVYDSWPHAVAGLAHVLYDDKGRDYAKVPLTPNLDGCQARVRCIVERAVARVSEAVELSRFVSSLVEARPARDVLAAHAATNVEKALLLRAALEASGVRARFGFLARSVDVELDQSFPSPGRGDHLLVVVEAQPGLDAPLITDPSCEACAAGQLPPWTRDRAALVFGQPRLDGTPPQWLAPVEIVRIPRGDDESSAHRQTIDATLEASGVLRGEISDEWRGRQAVDLHLSTRTWLDRQWRSLVEENLRARAKTTALEQTRALTWDKRSADATLGVGFRVPAYAALDGERLIVPLTFLRMVTDRELDEAPREHDVMLREASREEETLVVHVPDGWTVSDLPPSATWHSDAVDGIVEVIRGTNTIRIRRVVQTHVGHWGPGEYDEMVAVLRNVAAIRRAVFVVSPPR